MKWFYRVEKKIWSDHAKAGALKIDNFYKPFLHPKLPNSIFFSGYQKVNQLITFKKWIL